MRITRAAKVAAFPLIVLALVALVACQGGPGTKGEKGEKGDMGTIGAPGTNAPIALTGRVGDDVIDSLNAGKDKNEATEFLFDPVAAGYFNGGEAPYKFDVDDDTIPMRNGNAAALTAEIDEDTNKLKLKLAYTSGATIYTPEEFMTGFTIMVSAVDANKEKADSTITIKPNRAPALAAGVGYASGSVVLLLATPNDAYVIGTMDGDVDTETSNMDDDPRADGAASCSMFNSCEITLFADEGDFAVEVVSVTDGKFSWMNKGGKLVLKGLAAGEDIEVDVKAKDTPGLSRDVRFMLTVNAAPTMSKNAAALDTSIELEQGLTTKLFANVPAARAAFADVDDDGDEDVTVSYMSGNPSIVSIVGDTLTGEAVGTATVYAVGTTGAQGGQDDDGLGQSVKIPFTVRVTPSSASTN